MSKELLEYFNGDQMAADVWKAKYAYKGEETPDDMHRRLAREFARIEGKYIQNEPKKEGEYGDELARNHLSEYGYNRESLTMDKIFGLFRDFKYLSGQGSVMASTGTDTMSSLSNCFYLGSANDDITSIFQQAAQIANISKMRGGVGLDISTLRPNGGTVDNSAKTSSGAVSFMDVFDVVGQVIGQNNRRAALMISMHVNHPDVIDFITVKRDLKKVTAANISIKVTDEFMSAVENNEDYLLKFPVDSVAKLQDFENLEYNTLHEYYDIAGQKCYVKKVKAIDVWSEFVKSNHMSAEPGLLYYDRIHDYSPCTPYEKYRESGTNPSLRKGTKVLTKEGIFAIDELEGKRFEVPNADGEWKPAECFLSGHNKPLYKITLENDVEYYATSEHKWLVANTGKVQTSDLKAGMYFPISAVNNFGDKDEEYRGRMRELLDKNSLEDGAITEEEITELSELLGFCGIKSSFNKGRLIIDTTHVLTPQYELTEGEKFLSSHIEVKSVELTDLKEDVWDITVYDKTHTFTLAHCITGNCGEITLAPYDSCRLMISNLYGYCNEPFTKEASFDFDLFYKHSYELTRLCDDLVDLEIERVQQIIDKVKADNIEEHSKEETLRLWNNILEIGQQGRRLGVGFTALGDVVAAMGLRYGSIEALEFIEKIMKTKMEAELDCTVDLAILRGTFTDNSTEIEQVNGEPINDWYAFIKTEFPTQYNRMCTYGRRNVSISTIAPTGSVSIMTGTTGGLEPLFKPYYIRRKKINHNSDVKPDFVDVNGVGFTEHFVLHPKFKEWMMINDDTTGYSYALESGKVGSEYLEKCFVFSPYYKSTAEELDWKERVATQALLQKYITHSCSSTTNLPADVTEEDMSGIYLEGWKQGLKGITTYRDTCRDGIMISANSDKKGKGFEYHNAPKRPQKLHAKVIRFQNNYEKWVAFVGLFERSPYELFTAPLKDLNLPNSIEVGEIVKVRLEDGTKRFDFVYEGGEVQGLGVLLDKETYNYGRLLSGLLRHGMPIKYVVESINAMKFENDTVVSWKAGVVRALSKFDKSQDMSEKCPECGANLIKKEGCISCGENCGYSKCG